MKFIEVPDLHYDPKWGDITEKIAESIAAAAKEHDVDFVALPGDITNRAIMASESGGINQLRKIIRKITAVVPACAIYGTPSHEPPGSLEHLRDVGLVILEPGKIYGQFSDVIREIKGAPIQEPDAILFGVPELNKKTIQSQLGLSAEEANAETVNLFRRYVEEFIAPRRAQYLDIPAVLLMHGNVSDSHRENETDIVLRASDIVIHTEDLRAANLDRVTLGHIHTPWESRVISAGYAGFTGISDAPWGNRDFVPSMNLVEINQEKIDVTSMNGPEKPIANYVTSITRISYGTPERRKIFVPLDSYDPAIAYWLESDSPDAILPDNVHPWSRVTIREQRKETRRVTADQAAAVKTLRDLFLLADPAATESVLSKVDAIETATAVHDERGIHVAIESVTVDGCVLFGGKSATLDIKSLGTGPTAIIGANGSGKSSILAFCSPYPVIVGKDTDSGRSSAIKDFFAIEPARIRKILTVNGQTHEHLITVRGPHTQNPKTECYLTIDGAPVLDKGTFDEMFAKCEELYGPFSDYLLTTFYVQPQQSKHPSGLMSATMTDIRDLVQSIAGIDRESEKRYALDRVAEITDQVQKISVWLEQSSEFVVDISALEVQSDQLFGLIDMLEHEIPLIESRGKTAREKLNAASTIHAETQREIIRKQRDEKTIRENEHRIEELESEISMLEILAGQVAELKTAIETDDASREIRRQAQEIEAENYQKKMTWQKSCNDEIAKIRTENERLRREYQNASAEARSKRQGLDSERTGIEYQIQALDKPCPQCGYLDPSASEKLHSLRERRIEIEAELALVFDPEEPKYLSEESKIPEPKYVDIPDVPAVLSNRAELEKQLRNALESSAKIPAARQEISHLQDDIDYSLKQEYAIIENTEFALREAERNLEIVTAQYKNISGQLAKAEAEQGSIKKQIEKAREFAGKIESETARKKTLTTESEEWSYIARMFQPAKIPALELELVVDSIDSEATRILEPYETGRFSYRTETQVIGKNGMVDRFDVLVHDGETGDERSLLKFSPGQKAFLSDAYVKSLVRQRNERRHRHYDPVVMDESDGPISPEMISAYYSIQRGYWTENRVLVVSHNPTSHEHIEQTIKIEDIRE